MKKDRLLNFFGDKFHKGMFLFFAIVAVGLLITSFFIPPLAIIDKSVIMSVGELFAFAALGEVGAAIERGHGASITHGNTTIEIKKEDEEEMEEEFHPHKH